jgi:hypothetical protein
MNKRLLAALLVVATTTLVASGTATADPSGPNVRDFTTYDCDSGDSVLINTGPATNAGRVAWAVNSTSIFVVKYFAVTDGVDTFVFFENGNGVEDLITCTTPGRPGDTLVAKGFFTPGK